MKALQLFILIAFAAYFAGCATVPPTELVNARSAYQIASEGPRTARLRACGIA